MTRDWTPLRPLWLLLPLGLLFAASLTRLVQLQVLAPPERAVHALERMQSEHVVDAPRAMLLDRLGRPLALDLPRGRLVLDQPYRFRRHRAGRYTPAEAAAELAPLAQAAGLGLDELLDPLLDPDKNYKVLAGGLSPGTSRRIQSILRPMPDAGLRVETYWERHYPQGRALSHVLGLTGFADDAEGVPVRRGRFGLELALDERLVGAAGVRRNMRVGAGHGVNPLLEAEDVAEAAPVRTTLDLALGSAVRAELEGLVAEHKPKWVVAVAIDARTGGLLATCSLPDFDPNPGAAFDVVESLGPDGKLRRELAGMTDWSTQPFEPGSVMKPFVVARALSQGAIGREERFEQHGGHWRLPGRVISNALGVENRPLAWDEVLVQSSNIGAAKIGRALGVEGVRELLDQLQFAAPTGLLPHERAGVVPPDEQWRASKGRNFTVPSVSFGHQFTVTPLRLAHAYVRLVRGGPIPAPHILLESAPEMLPALVTPEVAAEVVVALEEVVASRRWLPAWDDLRWGGKSGTVAKMHEDGYTSLFVAFGPIEDPAVVIVVAAENPAGKQHYGSQVAGPAAGRILRRALELRGMLEPAGRLDRASPQAIVLPR